MQGATAVQGGFITNETWTVTGSPYLLTGDVIVPEGSYLAVEAGTEIVAGVDSGLASPGYIPWAIEFVIRGQFRCFSDGRTNRIVFRGERTSPYAWYGIRVEATNNLVAFENLEVRNARHGLRVNGGRTRNVTVTNALITQCADGILVATGNVVLDRVKVFACTNGIWGFSGTYFSVQNSLVYANKHYGIGLGSASIVNCTIHGNGRTGVRVADWVEVANSLVTSNGGYGFEAGSPLHSPSISISDSIVWGNRLGASAITYGPTHDGFDPQYLDAIGPDGVAATGDEDFSLRATSPAIDAGGNGLVPRRTDLAGSPRYVDDPMTLDRGGGSAPIIDIGAYEFQPPLRCVSLQPGNGGMTLSFNTIPGQTYAIEVSDDLSVWNVLPDSVSGTGAIAAVELAENGTRRFYRVRTL